MTRRGAEVRLPLQSEVLEQVPPARAGRARAVRKRARPARAKAGSKARKRKGRKSR